MSKPRFDLAGAINDPVSTGRKTRVRRAVEEAPVAAPAKQPRPPSRQGAKGITIWVDPVVLHQIKGIAWREQTTLQDLMLEGMDLVFKSRGLARIASKQPS